MNTSTNEPTNTTLKNRKGLLTGSALVLIGLLNLLAQFKPFESIGLLFLPALGLIFLTWGLLSRQAGLLIPGGILSGLGAGVALVTGPLSIVSDPQKGGVILLSFAAGWALITLLSALIRDTQWWALIPGTIMGLIGTALMVGGQALDLLEYAGRGWPLILIAAGLYVAFWRRDRSE